MRALTFLLCSVLSLKAAAQDAPLAPAEPTQTRPLHPACSLLVVPMTLLAPGTGHLVRGEREDGLRLLKLGGIFLGSALAGLAFLGATGASDVSAGIGVPIALVGVSGFLSMGSADAVGTFASGTDPLPQVTLSDAWNRRLRTGVELVIAPRAGLVDRPLIGAFATWREPWWMVRAEGGGLPGTPDAYFGAGAGVRLVRFSETAPRSGLWLEAGVRRELVGSLGFDSTRLRAQLVAVIPMGLLAERAGRLSAQIRLGVDPTWTRFRVSRGTDFEFPINGGFELRLSPFDVLRVYGGYEHARDSLVGGVGTGFLGAFYAGLEFSLPAGFVVGARILAGTPLAVATAVEWRW